MIHDFFTKNKIPRNLPFTFLKEPPSTTFIQSYIPNYLPKGELIAKQRMASAMNLPKISTPFKKDENELNTSSASARRKKL